MSFTKHGCFALITFMASGGVLVSPAAAQQAGPRPVFNGCEISQANSTLEVSAVADNTLRVDVQPNGLHDARTLTLDPTLHFSRLRSAVVHMSADKCKLTAPRFMATLLQGATVQLTVADRQGTVTLHEEDLLRHAAQRSITLTRSDEDPVYGIDGIDMNVQHATLTRTGTVPVSAGIQGNGGAPLLFTRRYAVLIDSIGGSFSIDHQQMAFSGGSRHELEFFIVIGSPLETRRAITELSGHAPMPPRWTLGFLNSQWGSSESEVRDIVDRYRAEHIPLDGFILDFDWKAWGEDNYGEWRWNSTSGPGNTHPDLFPNGSSGKFAADMRAEGVHLTGIMKPRILLYKPGSTTELDDAAAYAGRAGLWYPGEPDTIDYVTHRPSKDLNFNLPETRTWFWDHLLPAFHTGIEGFWNDEADRTDIAHKKELRFNDLQHFNMARAEYEGQRASSSTRVWTINRNYLLGSQRYAYAEWSGDIQSGSESMAQQPIRMLAAANIGEEHWSMDTGGFHGHPSPENYARWMQFAAFVPIFRVHGELGEKRQPWLYGDDAQRAATKAIDLRYSLMPYIYSVEGASVSSGVGLVRPLGWIFPDDATAAEQTEEWMFGDALLIAPILKETPAKSIYLPAGQWWDYATGRRWQGDQSITWEVDTKHWSDIPIFVREGSIVATNPVAQSTDAMHPREVRLDIFPSRTPLSVVYYEDDGATYAYETGDSFKQQITAVRSANGVTIHIRIPHEGFHPSATSFALCIHGLAAGAVSVERPGKPISSQVGPHPWSTATDRFGPMTTLSVESGRALTIHLTNHAAASRKSKTR